MYICVSLAVTNSYFVEENTKMSHQKLFMCKKLQLYINVCVCVCACAHIQVCACMLAYVLGDGCVCVCVVGGGMVTAQTWYVGF
jgi:hypothetical protein